jgi:4-amino-4-deoxy-L-arabinose transferase-like glycosyltransferase
VDRNSALALVLFIGLDIVFAFYQPFSKSFFSDEGQYLLISKKMLDGWVPYRDIIDDKPLGLYLMLMPAVLLCGTDIVKIRLYGALIAGLGAFLVFLLGEKLKNRAVGWISAFAYIFIGAYPAISGYDLITEPIANLFIVALFYILISRKKTYSDFFLIGILAALSCSVRQTCIFVFAPLIFDLAYSSQKMDKKKMAAAVLGGIGVIAIPVLLYLTLNSALWDAIYWCGYANVRFWRSVGIEDRIADFSAFSVFVYPLLLFAAVTLWSMTREKKLVWLWLLSGLVMVQIGWTFHNYFLLAPPLSVLAALGATELYKLSCGKGRLADAYRGVFILLSASTALILFFELSTIAALESSMEHYNKQWVVSEYIVSHTNKDDGIFVFMCDPYIYYITDRKPVTKMTFFWIDIVRYTNDAEKNEYIFEPLDKEKPKYFVMNPLIYENDSSLLRIQNYLKENYSHVQDWGIYHLYERKQTGS